MKFQKISLSILIVSLSIPCAHATKPPKLDPAFQLTPEQAELVEKAIGREQVLIKNIEDRTPLVETYVQRTKPDARLFEVPVDDEYLLSRVDFGKGFFNKAYQPLRTGKEGLFKGSFLAISGISKLLRLNTGAGESPLGFTQMMFLDPSSFDTHHYTFNFVRREFLGSVRTWAFDVYPKEGTPGRFYGRVWIEDVDGNVVRFNGTFTAPKSEEGPRNSFHFDSWRINVQPGIWLPVAVYVEELGQIGDETRMGLKAQTHFWGYSLKLPTRQSENVSVHVDDAVDKSADAQDLSPQQAARNWAKQSENNALDRLVEAGLVAPLVPDGFETKVLDQIVVNLAVPNNLPLIDQVHCRILLSSTVEATTIGDTILLSKGLIDSLPNEEAIASVVAMELAHIELGHHTDTRYAFNDQLLFPDEAVFHRIRMNHTDADDTEAARKAVEYLQASMYKDKLGSAGLYWAELAERGKALKALNTPKLGDSMLKADGTPWMADLARSAPRLNWDDLNQVAALPLGSWLKTDPWDDKVHMLNAARYTPINARDKMPLEVTPIYYKLQRYEVASSAMPPPMVQPPAQPANGTTDTAPQSAPATTSTPQ